MPSHVDVLTPEERRSLVFYILSIATRAWPRGMMGLVGEEVQGMPLGWLTVATLSIAVPIRVAAQQRNALFFEHVHALAIDTEGRLLFLGAHTGLFRSEDSGRNWKKVAVSEKLPHLDVMTVTPDPNDPKTIYVGTHEAGVFKSSDGGLSWKQANSGLGGMDVHGLAIDPNNASKLHVAIRDKGEGIYRTVDGGIKWIRVDDGPEGEIKVLKSVNIPTGMGGIFLYAGTSTGLQRSPDCF